MKHSSESDKSGDRSSRFRQRILATFLPVAAILYIAAEAVAPKGSDQLIQTSSDAQRMLAVAAKHPTQLYLAVSFAIVGLGCLAVSYIALTTLVKNRGAKLATAAAFIGGTGAFFGAITNILVFPNLVAAATAHITSAAASQFLVTSFTSGFGQTFIYVYAAGEYLAPFLMGLALWRSKSVPRWQAALFFGGLQVAELQSSSGPKVILFMLPFALAMFLLSVHIWKRASEQFGEAVNPH